MYHHKIYNIDKLTATAPPPSLLGPIQLDNYLIYLDSASAKQKIMTLLDFLVVVIIVVTSVGGDKSPVKTFESFSKLAFTTV